MNPTNPQGNEVLEGASLSDLQSQSPERRLRALEILYRNACIFYGESSPVALAELKRLEDARSEVLKNESN